MRSASVALLPCSCLGHLWLHVTTVAQWGLFCLQSVAVKKVDLVVDVYFTSCNGSVVTVFRENSLFNTTLKCISLFDTRKLFLPYLTRGLNFMPFMTLLSIFFI